MAWDKTRCEEGILAPDLNNAIRANYEAIEADINREHLFSTGGTAADQIIHRQGSARCFWQATAPAARIDGDGFTSNDNGSVWIDSDDNKIYILTDYSGPTWTSIESVTIATFLAAARTFAAAVTFDVAAVLSKAPTLTEGIVANDSYLQARNAADDGNVDLIKADGSDVPTLPDGSALATSAAPTADAEIANMKYVVDQIAAIQDPAYSGGESHTFDGGLIIKRGVATSKTNGATISFAASFPTNCLYVGLTTDAASYTMGLSAKDADGFTVAISSGTRNFYWMAIGY